MDERTRLSIDYLSDVGRGDVTDDAPPRHLALVRDEDDES